MTEESDEKKGFVVKDKRRFDSGGNEKSSESEAQNKDTTIQTKKDDLKKAQSEEAPQINFSSFVMSLATQALIQLGEIPPPEGVDMPVDLISAKQTIDILSMLQVKTDKNLEASEQSLMEEILHSLRMSYISKSR